MAVETESEARGVTVLIMWTVDMGALQVAVAERKLVKLLLSTTVTAKLAAKEACTQKTP